MEHVLVATFKQNCRWKVRRRRQWCTIFEHELTQEVVDALKAKRKAKLAEVKSGNATSSETAEGFEKNTSTPAPQTTYNPFAQH